MGAFHIQREIIRKVDSGTTIPATSATGVKFILKRRSNRRLMKMELVMNLTVSAAMVVGTNGSSFRLEGFVKNAKFRAADNGEGMRDVVNATGADLLAWDASHAGTRSEAQQKVWGGGLLGASTTYDYILPIHCVHPASRGAMQYLQSMPFHARTNGFGLASDPEVTFDFATLDDEFLGLKTGTITVNDYYLVCYWAHIRDDQRGFAGLYAPSELTTFDFNSDGVAQSNAKIPFPKDGRLTSFQAMEFSSPSVGTLGEVLTNGSAGYYKLTINSTEFDEFNRYLARHARERYRVSYPGDVAPGSTHNFSPYIWDVDFWHNTDKDDGFSLASVPNLYTENRGDLLELVADKLAASKRIHFLTHKWLINDDRLVIGA